MSVSVVTTCFGDYNVFLPVWIGSIYGLSRTPDEVIVASDRDLGVPGARVIVAHNTWKHAPAFFINEAVKAAETDWVWVMGVDDLAFPDALDGLEDVEDDVWQMGYKTNVGTTYIPPQLSAVEFLAAKENPFVGASAFRTQAFKEVGGYPDVAYEDWGLWRRLAITLCTFKSSGRAHFIYVTHPQARSQVQLHERADEHWQEMKDSEA